MTTKEIIKSLLAATMPTLLDQIQAERYLRRLPSSFVEHLKSLPEDSVVIDIGANTGLVSISLAKRAAHVHAFEPDKEAIQELRKRASRFTNIFVYEAAAGTVTRETMLFLHDDYSTDSRGLSVSSSLLASKPNVAGDNGVLVREIDLVQFIDSLCADIELIKIDIEGYEIPLVNHLLDNCDFDRIGRIYVETHDHNWPELVGPTRALKQRVKDMGLERKFDFDWI